MVRPLPRTICLQLALAVGALATVALSPPAEGPMLLVPLVSGPATALRVATASGTRLIGMGPGGTLVVWAEARALRPLVAAGVLPLAAPFSACGTSWV